jgi:hypothetical protein
MLSLARDHFDHALVFLSALPAALVSIWAASYASGNL